MRIKCKTKVIILTLGMIFGLLGIKNYNLVSSSNIEIHDEITTKNPKISGYWPNCPRIHIKNDNWSAKPCPWIQNRTGTYGDPHLIENITINAGGIGSGIFIEDSNDYFIINNCTVYSAGGGSNYAGIRLENTNNGTLTNNNCSNNNFGIYLYQNCVNNSISGNTANHNTIYGIVLNEQCNNSIISGNTANNNNQGILLYSNCYVNTISGNIAYNNTQNGINLVFNNDNNNIAGNTAYGNGYDGIYVWSGCDDNTISGNIIYYNNQYGVSLSSSCYNNLIYLNKFVGNGLNAIDNGTNNRWDNGLIGNYWDDYTGEDVNGDDIGDIPYNVSGNAGSKDYFPVGFFAPLITIHYPFENQVFQETAPAFSIAVDVTYLSSTRYTLNNGVTTINFPGLFGFINQDLWDTIPNGPVTITFYAKDIFDNEQSEEVTIIKNVTADDNLLQVEITEHSYSMEYFNFTFFVFNEGGQGINSATFQIWWNGVDVSNIVINLGNGLYFISLVSITVAPEEDPILLKMIISASGYEDKQFETYLAVDPDTLEKEVGKVADGAPLMIILIAIISTAGGIAIATATAVLLRKRKRASEVI